MAYVPVPKDMNAVKTKVAFNLTKRQIVCFGAGLLVGLPVFFPHQGTRQQQYGNPSHGACHAAFFHVRYV